MELTTDQQIFELIKKSGSILIVLPENLTADGIASGLAFRLFLTKLSKNVSVVSSGSVPQNLQFLPGASLVQSYITAGKSFVITVDTSKKNLEEISYQTLEAKAQIYIKSTSEAFAPEDLSFEQEQLRPDLIIFLGARSPETLGKLFEQSPDLFFETPKINIDNQAGNEYFGTVNLVEVTATSVAEILAELLQKYEEQLIDEDIATCLLAGIIANTHSFQHVQTTPKAFLKASELVSFGGRQQEIVKNIYQTKSLPLLRLWGRALARMKILEGSQAIYSVLTLSDFEKASSGVAELLPVLAEFIDNVSGYNVIALVCQPAKNFFIILVAAHEQVKTEALVKDFTGEIKPLDLTLGHYKVWEITPPVDSLESLEARFAESVKNL